jgi:hypothetical protein
MIQTIRTVTAAAATDGAIAIGEARASSYNPRAMKLGSAAVLAVALAASGGLGSQIGCSHVQSRPPPEPVVDPDEHPPLPPASGTPIGFLVDEAGALQLSDDQLSKLRAINDDLAGKLAIDDSGMVPEPVDPPKKKGPSKGGLGFRASGAQDNSSLAGGGVPGMGTGGNSGDDGPTTTTMVIPADVVTRVYRSRAKHIREAIATAMKVFDRKQQQVAQRVLIDHGVDPDTGEVKGGDPGQKKLEEPKPGQPLPREKEN